jgi:O-antigen ligase
VPFLAVYCVLLFAIPAQLIVPGMGANGSPASVVALLGFGWWAIATLVPGEKEFRTWNPVRFGLAVYLAVVLLCWALGKMRPLTPLESSTSDRALMAVCGLAGIALVTMDGLRSLTDVRRVVNLVIGCSMVMVGVGLVQFFFGYDLARSVRIPGLQYNAQIAEIQTRSIFNRPRGTSLHPIEYGVVAAALLPLAYWRASALRTKRALLPVAALFLGAMVSISRSAVLSFAVVGVVLLVGTTWKQRFVLVASTVAGVVVAGTLVNGLVGTIKSLFTGAEHDPSVQARLERFPDVVKLVSEYPWLGRGFGTYTPEDYFLLDNEIQKTAIESGLIGVAALVLFIVFVCTVAWRARGTDELSRLFGIALAASILGIFISTYTFDAFYYKILMGVVYLCIGLVGAFWRLTAADRVQNALPDWSTETRTLAPSAGQPAITA